MDQREALIPNGVVRDSQIELLRIVAMMMVLLLHVDFAGMGEPTQADFLASPLTTWSRMIVEALSIVAVDTFVLISGWYGIRFRARRLGSFLFQVWFFAFVLYFAALPFDSSLPLTPRYMGHLVVMDPYWFARSYLLLYLCSPVLNVFVRRLHNPARWWGRGRGLLVVIAVLAVVQSFWGWWGNCRLWGAEGDSVLTFVFVYMVGRWLRLYGGCLTRLPKSVYAIAYVALCLVVASLAARSLSQGDTAGCDFWYKNTSLPVIAAAVSLFLLFRRLSFHSVAVNKVAASCFAVYLFNCSPTLFHLYTGLAHRLFTTLPLSSFLFFAGLLVIIYFGLALLLDQFRIFAYIHLVKKLCTKP